MSSNKQTRNVNLDIPLIFELEKEANRKKRSVSYIVNEIVKEHFKKEK